MLEDESRGNKMHGSKSAGWQLKESQRYSRVAKPIQEFKEDIVMDDKKNFHYGRSRDQMLYVRDNQSVGVRWAGGMN